MIFIKKLANTLERLYMIIINNYEGSSIDIIEIDNLTNTAHLKLRDENSKASHYYNFTARNEKAKTGKIIIENINNSMYYSKDTSQPFIKKQNKWEKISSSNYKVLEDKIEFYVEPNSEQEISLVPRYTTEDLKKFCERKNIKYEKTTKAPNCWNYGTRHNEQIKKIYKSIN